MVEVKVIQKYKNTPLQVKVHYHQNLLKIPTHQAVTWQLLYMTLLDNIDIDASLLEVGLNSTALYPV